jgi:AcrR family transcriptional regulator
MPKPAVRRAGPRGGGADTREDILAAARKSFSEKGYAGTTLRAVATAAGVDVALIAYYFGSKDSLFAATMDVPFSPAEIIDEAFADGVDAAGPRLVEMFLGLWEGEHSGPAIQAMFRAAATHEQAQLTLSEFATTAIVRRYTKHITADHAERRSALVATQLVGMAMLRYILKIEPVVSMSREQLIADLGTTLQHYLTGPLDDFD